MDTFMDKLAQKFTAGEMIKANSAADLADVEKLKKQMEEYDQCLQEMRQVHLKNAENVEKLSVMIEEAMGKLGEVKGGSISTQDLEKRLEILLGANFDVKLSESMDSIREYIRQQNIDKEELVQSCYDKVVVELAQQNVDLDNKMAKQESAVEIRLSQMNELMNEKFIQQAEILNERLMQQNIAIGERLDQQSEMLSENGLERQNAVLEDKLAKQQSAILEEVDGVRAHLAARIGEMKNEMKNTKSDYSEIKVMLDEVQASNKAAREELLREMQDYVHKEDVKVYRNVQAVVVEQGEKTEEQFGTVNKRMTAELGLVTKLAGGALALSAVSVILQLLIRFGIF